MDDLRELRGLNRDRITDQDGILVFHRRIIDVEAKNCAILKGHGAAVPTQTIDIFVVVIISGALQYVRKNRDDRIVTS